MAYVDYTLDEWTWKAANNKRFNDTKTTPVDSTMLEDLQEAMHKIIKANPDELAMFGSFFFVMDSRGIKKSTVVLTSDGNSPYTTLLKNFPSLDWEYMMRRKNGQLFMDLGMAFHPSPHDKEPRVGLWRLDKLHASYVAAGMGAGTVHHFNTFANYGNMQSEMPAKRAATVQLSFRQSYSLHFEIIRRPGGDRRFAGGDVYFCEDGDAYAATPSFMKCLDDFDKMYMGAEGKSYGVREEIRGSGIAIRKALLEAPDEVCTSTSFIIHYIHSITDARISLK
jgi:hypothetical protein